MTPLTAGVIRSFAIQLNAHARQVRPLGWPDADILGIDSFCKDVLMDCVTIIVPMEVLK